jgi:hypothetical protein
VSLGALGTAQGWVGLHGAGEDGRSDGKNGGEGAGAGQMVCGRRSRLAIREASVGTCRACAAGAAIRLLGSRGDID